MDCLRALLLFATAFVASSASLLTGCGSAPISTPQSQAIPTLPATPSSPAPNPVAAYVFTVDSITLAASEFSLSASGQLQQTKVSVPFAVPVSTAHAVVYQVPKQLGSMQSYTLEADGSLQAQGVAVSYPVNRSASLASDNASYVYAVSDKGIYGFESQITGLTPIPSAKLTTPQTPCPPQDLPGCQNMQWLTVSGNVAVLGENSTIGYGSPNPPQLSTFTRSDGQLTPGQVIGWTDPYGAALAPTPDGRFLYLLDEYNRLLMYDLTTASWGNTPVTGAQGTYFWQIFINPAGSFLFVAEAPPNPSAFRVFQIDASSGNLTEVTGSPFSTGEGAAMDSATAVTLDPTGHFLLATFQYCNGKPNCTTPGKLVAMSINQTAGALTVTSDVQDGVYPAQVTAAVISH